MLVCSVCFSLCLYTVHYNSLTSMYTSMIICLHDGEKSGQDNETGKFTSSGDSCFGNVVGCP